MKERPLSAQNLGITLDFLSYHLQQARIRHLIAIFSDGKQRQPRILRLELNPDRARAGRLDNPIPNTKKPRTERGIPPTAEPTYWLGHSRRPAPYQTEGVLRQATEAPEAGMAPSRSVPTPCRVSSPSAPATKPRKKRRMFCEC